MSTPSAATACQNPFPELTLSAFEAAEIDAEAFDHERHIYIGWLYLQNLDLGASITRFSKALSKITKKFGCEDKYHETITWAFMILIAERLMLGT